MLLAGLVIRTRSKPAAVGSPSKKDDKSTANGDDAEKTKASDEVPPFLSALVFLHSWWDECLQCSAHGGRTHPWVLPQLRVGASTNSWWAEHCVTGSGRVARKTRVVACACEGQNVTICVLVLQAEDADGDEEKEDERDVRPSFLGV